MKIVFFGDSITDATRNKELDFMASSYGFGYVHNVAEQIMSNEPNKYVIYNRGISGNRVVDLYARIKKDLWNLEPDLISIFVGTNDVWHEIKYSNGVELDRFEKVYRMMIEDTKKVLPNAKMILIAPFIMKGSRTEEQFDEFLYVYEYAKVVEKLAKEYGLGFVELQSKMNEKAELYGTEFITFDGVHPNITGAKIISDAWLTEFEKIK